MANVAHRLSLRNLAASKARGGRNAQAVKAALRQDGFHSAPFEEVEPSFRRAGKALVSLRGSRRLQLAKQRNQLGMKRSSVNAVALGAKPNHARLNVNVGKRVKVRLGKSATLVASNQEAVAQECFVIPVWFAREGVSDNFQVSIRELGLFGGAMAGDTEIASRIDRSVGPAHGFSHEQAEEPQFVLGGVVARLPLSALTIWHQSPCEIIHAMPSGQLLGADDFFFREINGQVAPDRLIAFEGERALAMGNEPAGNPIRPMFAAGNAGRPAFGQGQFGAERFSVARIGADADSVFRGETDLLAERFAAWASIAATHPPKRTALVLENGGHQGDKGCDPSVSKANTNEHSQAQMNGFKSNGEQTFYSDHEKR